MQELKIKDVGPIQQLTIPIPEEGGVVCLYGQQGAGKSMAVEAAKTLLLGEGRVPVRDRAAKGSVEGFGVKVSFGRSTRRTGELECLSLESELDLDTLVNPGLKDENAADAKRIKALIQLTGAKADPALFTPLFTDANEQAAILGPDSLSTDDLVEMAAKVKRDLEKAARKAEDLAENHQGSAKALQEQTREIDLTAPSDSQTLQNALEEALQEQSRLKQQAEDAAEVDKRQAEASEKLARAKAAYTGPTEDKANEAMQEATKQAQAMKLEWEAAAEKARQAERDYQQAGLNAQHAISVWQQARTHAGLLTDLGQILDSPRSYAPQQTDLEEAAVAVTKAREALEHGAAVRKAKEAQAEATRHLEQVVEARKTAQRLRDAAKQTDEILSQAVHSDTLWIEAGRLVLNTERGVELFSELSCGERLLIAVDIALEQADRYGLNQTALLTVGQSAWSELSDDSKRMIANHAKERKAVIITAQATDSPLHAEIFQN